MENCYFLKLPREWAEDIGWSFSLFIFMSCFKARLLSNTFDFFLFLVYSGSSPMYDKLEGLSKFCVEVFLIGRLMTAIYFERHFYSLEARVQPDGPRSCWGLFGLIYSVGKSCGFSCRHCLFVSFQVCQGLFFGTYVIFLKDQYSSVECPFCLWMANYLLGSKIDEMLVPWGELFIAKECWSRVAGSFVVGGFVLIFFLALYCSFKAVTSSSWAAQYEAQWSALLSGVGLALPSLLWIWRIIERNF